MLPLITTRKKDDLLRWLCSTINVGATTVIDPDQANQELDIDDDMLYSVLDGFEELDLIKDLTYTRGAPLLTLKTKAHMLLQQGGFAVIDVLNEANMQKLLYELEVLKKQLQPDQTEAMIKITTIMASIATVVQAYSG